MIRHVVMFAFEEGASEQQISVLAAALDRLPGAIPEVLDYRHGRDLGLSNSDFGYGLVADFAGVDEFAAYRDHPDHQRFIADHIVGKVARRAGMQFSLDT